MTRTAARNNPEPGARRGVFDVLVRHAGRVLAAFYVIWALLAGLLSYARIATAENPPLDWPEIAIIVIVAVAATVGAALPLAFGIMEGIPMALAKLYTDRVRAESREEGRVEGREEGREEGLVEGREEGRVEGHTEGRVEGRQEGRVEGHAEGRQEGRAQSNRLWREWNRRRLQAERDGLPFNEPTPDADA